MKALLVLLVCLSMVGYSMGMTRAQLKNTAKMMKTVCQPKNKVTGDQIDHIRDGVFNEDQNVKCYIACVLQMAQTIKNGKLNYESAKKQIDVLFPEDMRPGMKKALDVCRDVTDKYKDVCEASFQTAKCMYDSDPASFFFP